MKELPLNQSDMRRDEYWVLVALYSLLLPLHILNTFTVVSSVKAFYIPVAILSVYNFYHFKRFYEGLILKNILLIGCLALIPVIIFKAPLGHFVSYVLSFFTLLGLPAFPKKHIYLVTPFLLAAANLISFRYSPWPGLPWRYQGLYNDPNYYVLSLIVGIYLCIRCIEVYKSYIIKGVSVASILISLYVILLTQSRGGIIALLLFVAIYIPVLYKRYQRLTVLGILLLIASSGSIYMRFQAGFDGVVSRFTGERQADVNGANSRIYEIEAAIEGIENNPIYLVTGSGLGSTGAKTAEYENEHRIHNTGVALVFENGLIALFLFLSFFWCLAQETYETSKVSCALVISLFLQCLTIWTMTFLPFWLGLLITLDYTDEEDEDEESEEIDELNEICE